MGKLKPIAMCHGLGGNGSFSALLRILNHLYAAHSCANCMCGGQMRLQLAERVHGRMGSATEERGWRLALPALT